MREPTKIQQVIDFVRGKSIVRPLDLEQAGLPRGYLSLLSRRGVLERVGAGLYRFPGAAVSEHQSLIEVCSQCPNAVVALLSALSFHNLMSQS